MVFGLCIATLAGYGLIPREPSFQGRRCRAWLPDFDSSTNYTEACKAIQEMGTSTLPYLIAELQAKDSTLRTKLMELAGKQSMFKFRFTSDHLRHTRAVKACQALGPLARPAIPALGTALGNGVSEAAGLLGRFGPESVSSLGKALTNAPGCAPPYCAAHALGKMGANARNAMTNLAWNFQHNRISYPCAAAAHAMAEISLALIENEHQPDCPEVLLAKGLLLGALSGTNRNQVVGAASALALLGDHAKEAVPLLSDLLDNQNPWIREAATNALKAIAPQTERLTGVW